MAHRGNVFKLLRACLNSAKRCPSKEQEVMLRHYIRNRFASERNLIEDTKVHHAMNAAWEEVQQMNYYHDLRENTSNPSPSTLPTKTPQSHEKPTTKMEQSRVDPRMVIIHHPRGLRPQGVAEVVDSLRHFGPLQSVRCGDNIAEAVFKCSADAEKSVMGHDQTTDPSTTV